MAPRRWRLSLRGLSLYSITWTVRRGLDAEDRKIADAMTGYGPNLPKPATQIVQIYRLGHSMACNNTKP